MRAATARPPGTAPATAARLALSPEALRRRVDPASLPFETTADVAALVGTIGQPRAVGALDFGLAVDTPGYNLFVAGEPGSGRATTVRDYLDPVAAARPAPRDWVYVHNFSDPARPDAIGLPAGRAAAFARDMDSFVEGARREIARAFESEEYERRQREILGDLTRERDRLTEELVETGREFGFAVKVGPIGVVSTPTVKGQPLTREEFEQLPEPRRLELERHGATLQDRNAEFLRRLHQLERETVERTEALAQEVGRYATAPLFQDLRERYASEPDVLAYLADVEADVLASLDDLRAQAEPGGLSALLGRPTDLARYSVNVLVDNSELRGAPVVVERNPTYYNLGGRVEYRAAFGAMVTDFREIKPGCLHRANGGFLVVDALAVLRHPFAWEALKRSLRGSEVRIENLGEEFSAVPTASLRPEPIPLDVKVVLIGPTTLYHLLYQFDEEFRELFKVKVDFSPEMPWGDPEAAGYASFVSRYVREHGLRHFDAGAVARVIEHGGRLRDSQRKLSTRLLDVADVATEASFWAKKRGGEVVSRDDVDRAIRTQQYRSSLLEERVQQLIADGTLVIDTEGEHVGQVNGIAILDLGDYAFGRPSRVTARVGLGRAGVRSIERETELSGPIHSKGFLTLLGYVSGTYAEEWPLSLTATLTFEQSYDEVEGDSASAAELIALLSALAELPCSQQIAITGSVDQNGALQAVGGVNRKIEGFFATCKAQGLTGWQGVVLPAANAGDLMLDEEVVEAVRSGTFHVWAVREIDEALELVTGVPAGTVHALVQNRLERYAMRLSELAEEAGLGAAANGPD